MNLERIARALANRRLHAPAKLSKKIVLETVITAISATLYIIWLVKIDGRRFTVGDSLKKLYIREYTES